MTQLTATKRNQGIQLYTDEILKLRAEGWTLQAIAEKYGVNKSQVSRLLKQNSEFLTEVQQAVVEQTADVLLTTREGRIRELAQMYEDIDTWQEEHTLTEHVRRYDKDGNEVGDTIRFRDNVVTAKRGVIDDIAKEMGERTPEKGARGLVRELIVREYSFDVEALD